MTQSSGVKRSAGVTAWAIVLIIAGVWMVGGSLISLAVGPQLVEMNFAQVKLQLESMPAGEGPGQMTAEMKTKILSRVDEIKQNIVRMIQSPLVTIMTWVRALFGVLALVAGIGVLQLREWGRRLVSIQAAGALALGLWGLWVSPQRQIAEQFLAAMTELMPPAAIMSLRQAMVMGQALSLGLGLALLLAWNGVLIWFFNRASVKAQF